jgi:hypothetical protein
MISDSDHFRHATALADLVCEQTAFPRQDRDNLISVLADNEPACLREVLDAVRAGLLPADEVCAAYIDMSVPRQAEWR